MFSWARNWVKRMVPAAVAGKGQRRRVRPSLEILEDRVVLSVQFRPGPLAAGTVNAPVVSTNADFTADNVEPLVKVNTANPTQLIVGSQCSWTTSVNNGATFTTPRETPFFSDGDTATVFD